MVRFIRLSFLIALLAAGPVSVLAQAPAPGAPAQGPVSGQLSDRVPELPPALDAAGNPVLASPAKPVSAVPEPESTVEKSQPFKRSFFFSPEDLASIQKALRGVFTDYGQLGKPVGVIPQVRTISLQGIYYKSPNDWMIWLNGRKVTRWVQPKEIQEIVVGPDVVHLKWFDIGANAVLKLDMHPGEIYDIVTGVSLPDQTPVKLENAKP